MLLRGLFFALLLYLLYRFITRKLGGGNRAQKRNQRFEQRSNGSQQSRKRKNLDHIEDAEFEDITEKEKK